jgi:Uma2 family endonuclease
MSAVMEVAVQAPQLLKDETEVVGEQRMLLHNIRWKTYERLCEDLGDQSHFRMWYDHGELEIMSPMLNHEVYGRSITALGHLIALELEIDLTDAGSTTLKVKRKKCGAEPDTCFYIKNKKLMRGKERVNLKKDPPPEVVLEVDITSSSIDKFSIYANFAVPELWHYDGGEMKIFWLEEKKYAEKQHSLAFPWLTPAKLTEFLDRTIEIGQTAALREFRDWLRAEVRQ